MADLEKRVDQNVPGPVFVDWTCIYCELCVEIAPEIFGEFRERGYAFVQKQPATEEEWARARQAVSECPTDSIGIHEE